MPSAGLVLRLAPCGVVVLHVHLLTAVQVWRSSRRQHIRSGCDADIKTVKLRP
jgi:hypothetical protein